MDFIEHDLKTLLTLMPAPFLQSEIKTLMIQLLSAVQHCHYNWILHRDLKTELKPTEWSLPIVKKGSTSNITKVFLARRIVLCMFCLCRQDRHIESVRIVFSPRN